ncbi:MAG: DnaJ domain-containing protein [Saprospiraceae bacterium]|nr:DnaJ domain-containing protein [Saprospiraceae bacterium]
MFKDYYAILEIGNDATSEEIKSAFKKQALNWHPDRNPGVDTTSKMQVINEAR